MPLKSPYPALDIPKVNILSYIFPRGEELPDTPLWIDSADDNISLSLRQLQQWCKRIAIGLDRLGVKPGSVVMVYTTNHVFVPAAYMGIVGSGRIFSGANPAYTLPGKALILAVRDTFFADIETEIVYQVKNTEAPVMLVHPSFIKTATAAVRQAGMPSTRIFQFSDVVNDSKDGIKDWREMLGTVEEADVYTVREFSPEEATRTVASLNYSSGTTGVPKGVCISHHALISNVAQSIFMRDLYKPYGPQNRPKERWVGFLPLYHAFGQLWTMAIAAKLRITVYVMKQFVLTDFLNVIQTRRITHFQAAPPIIVMLSKRPEVAKYDLSSVEDILCGAAPLSKELQNDVSKRFHIQINQGWGMTEVTCAGLIMPGGINDDTGSVGTIIPNCEAKLLDEQNREVGVGEKGELYWRGPQVFLGYWKNEEATKECLDSEGWLKSGDVALYNKDGWFWIVDRKKVCVNIRGFAEKHTDTSQGAYQSQWVAGCPGRARGRPAYPSKCR
jgi:4-coumarate--CoA ligase